MYVVYWQECDEQIDGKIQYLHCQWAGDTAVLHEAIVIVVKIMSYSDNEIVAC